MERELYLDPQDLKRFKIKKYTSQTLIYTFLIIMSLFIIIPFFWMLISSVKESWEITGSRVTLFPVSRETGRTLLPWDWAWENYGNLINGIKRPDGSYSFKPVPFGWMFLNTVVVGALTTLGTVITVVLAAFAFARLNFAGRETIFSVMLATMMIPGEVFVISNFMTISNFGWVWTPNHAENYAALVIPFVTSVFYTFFLRQTFKQIPNELYLAAKVDGTGDFKYLFKVMIPLAQATITTIIILSMIGTWNAYVWPSFVTDIQYPNQFLVSNGLVASLSGTIELTGADSVLNLQMAASTLVTVPLLIVFFAFKKYIMRGVSRSGIKG